MGSRTLVYLPQEFLVLAPDATAEQRSEVFKSNCDTMDRSDTMIAIMDEKDSGVTFEVGYGYHAGKRIIGVYLNPLSSVNVMLSESWYATCTSEQAFRAWLHNPHPIKYEGDTK